MKEGIFVQFVENLVWFLFLKIVLKTQTRKQKGKTEKHIKDVL